MKVLIIFAFAGLLAAQSTVNGNRTQGSGTYVDMHQASWRPPETVVGSLPAAAGVTGKVYVVTDGASSSDCTTGSGTTRAWCVSNGSAWVTLGGSGSSGSGVSYCAPASASGTTYTCAPSPAVSAYAAGTTLAFVPDVSGSGGATTVNANTLGAKSIKLNDGSTDPYTMSLVAGKVYTLTYDGSVFRMAAYTGQLCITKTINYGDLTPGSSAEISMQALPANWNWLPGHVFTEVTQFAGTSAITFCWGVTSSGSACGIEPAYTAKQASGTFVQDQMIDPTLLTYTPVIYYTSSAGTITAGQIVAKGCGYVY